MSGDRDHNYPFKFNQAWLLDQDFTQMVNRVWPVLQSYEADDKMGSLSHKLRMLKSEVKAWTKNKSSVMEKDSLRLDVEIRSLLTSTTLGILS